MGTSHATGSHMYFMAQRPPVAKKHFMYLYGRVFEIVTRTPRHTQRRASYRNHGKRDHSCDVPGAMCRGEDTARRAWGAGWGGAAHMW
jgi:hypothetical protein